MKPAMVQASDRSKAEAARIAAAMAITPGQVNVFEANPGGRATLHGTTGREILGQPLPGLDDDARMNFVLGEALFDKFWVSAPSSTKASDGLGPRYNARNCAACHPGNGRGTAPEGDGPLPAALLLRLSVPGGTGASHEAAIDAYLATRPDPKLGHQLQPLATVGMAPEGTPHVHYAQLTVTLADGTEVELRAPVYHTDTDLNPETMISPRLAPPLTGMGLIDAIRDADILAGADPDDLNGDGVSGRANIVPATGSTTPMLGRYGWKAEIATLRQQVADAFSNDIGISTPVFPAAWGDCTELQTDCRNAPHGDGDVRGTELDAEGLDLTVQYVASLAVPARTADPASVVAGRDLFHATGCAACHRPAFVTARRADDPLRGFQMIWPYSDFLLHDMGPGLADDRPSHRATGQEWRTPPLWSIGRTKQVSETEHYLHDGRARSLEEAILWHDGEAKSARDTYATLTAADRAALIAFLESL